MKNRKKLILSVSLLTALALFAGCSTVSAVSPEPSAAVVQAPAFLRLDEVKAIAYAHAGVSEAEATDRSYDFDDGAYEIEFDHGGWEYDYRIAPDGTIVKAEKTPEPTRPAETVPTETKPAETVPAETKPAETKPAEQKPAKSDRISAEKALSIALNHAGVTDARDRDVEWDDGRWEVSFDAGRTEYDYYIAADGSILRWDQEHND
jgi:uncharacterized membrane protein YkoI